MAAAPSLMPEALTGGHALNVLAGIRLMDLGGLEGVDDLVLNALGADRERALELGKALRRGAGAGELILLELDDLLLDLDGNGNDLGIKAGRQPARPRSSAGRQRRRRQAPRG